MEDEVPLIENNTDPNPEPIKNDTVSIEEDT